MSALNYTVSPQQLAQQMFAMQGLTGAQVPLLQLNQQFQQNALPLPHAGVGREQQAATGKKRGRKKQGEDGEPPKRQRSRKPPDAPKRPKSAYMFFLAEFRESWKAENPSSKKVADVAKAAGEIWRAMSAEKKAEYEERSTGAKQAYAKAMQSYEEEHPKPVRRPVKIRDPAELKRPQSAYFFFLADFREDYKKEHPTEQLQVAVLGKLAGERWKVMTEEEKAPYEHLSSLSKAEYAKQKMLTPDERRVYASMQSLQAQGLLGNTTGTNPLLTLPPGSSQIPLSGLPFGSSASALPQVSSVATSAPPNQQSDLNSFNFLQNFQNFQLLQNLQSSQAVQAAQAQAQVQAQAQAQAQAVQAAQHAQAAQAQAQAQVQAQLQAQAEAQSQNLQSSMNISSMGGMNNAYAAASQAQQAALMQSMLAQQAQALGQQSAPMSAGLPSAAHMQQLATSLSSANPSGSASQPLQSAFQLGDPNQMAAHSLLSQLPSLSGINGQQLQQAALKLDGPQG